MNTFAVVAHAATPTNTRLGTLVTPARSLTRLGPGDTALARLDVVPSLHGIESGIWALDLLECRGVRVLNRGPALRATHDKLMTAALLTAAGVRHPSTSHVAPWLPVPRTRVPAVLKPRFGSWGRDVVRCDTQDELAAALERARCRIWFNTTGGVLQELVPPCGYDLRVVVAASTVVGAVVRRAARGEWRTNVALGATRIPVTPPPEACELALAAAAAVGGDLVGVDLLPDRDGAWTVLEVNGAVDFDTTYSQGPEIFGAVRAALGVAVPQPSAGREPVLAYP